MNRYTNRKSFDLEWVERWARLVNEDRILPVRGRFFTGRFVIGIDDTDYLIDVQKGKVQRIAQTRELDRIQWCRVPDGGNRTGAGPCQGIRHLHPTRSRPVL